MTDEFPWDLKILRAVNQAQIQTLMDRDRDGDELFRAQVVEKILADDACFTKMTRDEAVAVLVALGFKPDSARIQAEKLKG